MYVRKIILFLCLIVLALGGIFFREQVEEFILNSNSKLSEFKKDKLDQSIANLETTVSAPPPLRSEKDSPNPVLTQSGTIKWTNINRSNNDLPVLKENEKLNEAALKKAKDIFERQYFDHISPSGEGPHDLATDVSYDYLAIGENLALGNFANDKELLEAWMDSPGHRENILLENFREIGAAVLEGEFEGKKTWVAVQEFGTPLSGCQAVDSGLKKSISANKSKALQMEKSLEAQKEQISKLRSTDKNLSKLINAYNAQAKEYNELVTRTKKLIDDYNQQVESFNSCIKKF